MNKEKEEKWKKQDEGNHRGSQNYGKTNALLGQLVIIHHDIGCRQVRLVLVREFSISEAHGLVEIFGIDSNGHFLGLLDSLHQWLSHNLVLVDGNEAGFGLGSGLQHSLDGFNTL